MTHLKQDKKCNCSQTCMAMLSNKSIREVEEVVGHDGGALVFDFNSICKKLNISAGKWVDRRYLSFIFFPLLFFSLDKLYHKQPQF